ncbi:MAG: hypothetical protein RML15_09180 [Bacteroidota bacterium]|nr:hypothetical protein [Candidatus Kapabacteria bacterium]MDW8075650.1 hypothetical protein [Bacteroidota bacterium]MDW8272564.1 hypothetical protein [Bacteroidota bacterium]
MDLVEQLGPCIDTDNVKFGLETPSASLSVCSANERLNSNQWR